MYSNSSRWMSRRERRLGDERAPGHIAGIERHDLRQALLADGGADAVGGDQQIALGAAAVAEVRDHRLARLSEVRDAPPAMILRARERVAQHAIDPLPGREHLRTFEVADQTACRVENLPRRDRDAEIGRIDAEPADAFDQVRLRDDAGAAAGQFALDPLEDIDDPSRPAAARAPPGARSSSRQPPKRAVSSLRSRPQSRGFQVGQKLLYIEPNLEECHGPDDAGQESRAVREKGLAGGHRRRVRARKARTPIRASATRWCRRPIACGSGPSVWQPGERVGFHRHVLDYFWTSVTGGRGRQHVHDGTTVEYTYAPGETRHETYGAGRIQGPRPGKHRRQGHGLHDHRVPAKRQQADGAARQGAPAGRSLRLSHLPSPVPE